MRGGRTSGGKGNECIYICVYVFKTEDLMRWGGKGWRVEAISQGRRGRAR